MGTALNKITVGKGSGKGSRGGKSGRVAAEGQVTTRRALNLELAPLQRTAMCLVLAVFPLFRGLFFPPELLPALAVVGGLTVVWLVDRVAKGEPVLAEGAVVRPWHRLQDWGAVVLFLCYLVGLIWAVDRQGAVRESMKMLAYLLLFLMAAEVAAIPRRAEGILQALVVGGALVAIVGIGAACGVVIFPGAFGGQSIMSTLQYENALAGFAMTLNLVAAGLTSRPLLGEGWRRIAQFAWRFAYAGASYMLVLVILGTRSRGGWVIYPLAAVVAVAGMGRMYIWRALFSQFVVFSVAMLVGRPFYRHVFSGEEGGPAGLRWFAVGLAVVLLAEGTYWLGSYLAERWRTTEQVRGVLRGLAVAYVVVVLAVYFGYAVQQLPLGWKQAVPVPVGETLPTVNLHDQSLLTRMYASRDALRIVRDRPWGAGGGGWNALYHQYQSTLYWTTETHNHFFQVWVEAGTGGFLAFLAVWVGTGTALYRFGRQDTYAPRWPLLWGAGVAAFTLGAHSALDFDLSLPAVAMYLWVLLGVVAGLTRQLAPTPAGAALGRGMRAGRRLATVGVAMLLALGLMWGAARFYAAGQLGAEAARAMVDQDLAGAEVKYLRATALDPFTASYAADLAQIYTAVGVLYRGAGPYYGLADKYLQKAIRAEPYSVKLRMAACDILWQRGEVDRAAGEARAVLKMLPLATESWEAAARAYVLAAQYHLSRGAPAAARAYLGEMAEMRAKMETLCATRGREVREGLFRGPQWTPALQVAVGQAAFLQGDFGRACRELEPVKDDGAVGGLARVWMAAGRYRLGEREEADKLVQPVTAKDGTLAEQYRQLLEQPVMGS